MDTPAFIDSKLLEVLLLLVLYLAWGVCFFDEVQEI